MKNFLILLNDKQKNLLTNQLLFEHIHYLKELKNKKCLFLCGPFADNQGAVLVLRAETYEAAEKLLKDDPFIKENYYKKYSIHEFFEANDENNWLCISPQTKENLNKN